ncbi:diphthine synthase [Candidatus Woesearchaeota archaeon]|nr:diphthine synthase [Candidatus Woesearchaeota archaeon]
MTLYLIGMGLNDEKDITLKGLEIVKRSDKVYLENYTAIIHCKMENLERIYGKKVHLADRDLVEKKGGVLVDEASKGDVALLVVGDPVSATTHMDLLLRAARKGVKVEIVHNASILTAVGVVGLQLYKYGRTASIVFPQEGWDVHTPYDVVKDNKKAGLHTLCLLDIKTEEPSIEELRKETKNRGKPEKPRFMTVKQAIHALLDIEYKRKENIFTDETICIGCARLGSEKMKIRAGRAKELLAEDFGEPMHCLIVPGKLHFMEEEALELWKQ